MITATCLDCLLYIVVWGNEALVRLGGIDGPRSYADGHSICVSWVGMIQIPYSMGKRPWGKNSISPPQKAPHFPRCGTRPKRLKSHSNKNDWENSKVLFWSSVEHWFDLNMFGSFEHVRGVFSGGLWGTKLPHGKPRKLINTRLACFGLLASSDWQL